MSAAQAKLKEATALHQQGQLTQAKALYEDLLKTEPNNPDVLHLLGVIETQTNNGAQAIALIDRAIEINSAHPVFYASRGQALQALQKFEAAIKSYDHAIVLKPDFAEAHFNRGNALQALHRFEEAVESYGRALAIKPNVAEIYLNRGLALHDLKRLEEAIENYDSAISIKPDYTDVYFNRGIALMELNRFEFAVESFDRALSAKPDFADAYFNRGNALQALKQYKVAVESYDCCIAIKPDFADAYVNRGNALQGLQQCEAAIESYDRAIAVKPDFPEAYVNRGNALQELMQLEEALENHNRAIEINPNFVDAYINRGNVLRKLEQLQAAVESYDKAIGISPNCVDAHVNRATVLQELHQFKEAVESYYNAFHLKSDFPYLLGTLLHTKMKISDWSSFEEHQAEIIEKIAQGEKYSPSFPLFSVINSLSIQKKAAEIFSADKRPFNNTLGNFHKKTTPKKIRIGYFSADFWLHPVSILLVELIERHDKNHFEIIAFSFSPNTQDAMRMRLEKAFDQFIDVRHLSDQAIAQLSRDMNIDIAVDLGGDTGNSRPGLFSYRAAPIQVCYLGYLGTMGADYFDYLIADKTIIPEKSRSYYSEKVVYLPSYQANDSKRKVSEKKFTKQELGLPDEGFIFCCFNNNYKITPPTFDGWMRILKAVAGSVLFLYADNKTVEQNLKKEAQARGVDANRLIFGARLEASDYLARYKAADLFLDTFPYNAGTTASDALWVGLPVLTLMGETFASRVAASLLTAIELPELITRTQEEFEALAIELAMNPIKFRQIKNKLMANRLTTALFNTTLFTQNIEKAYTQMVERYHADLKPDHIYIE